MKKGGRSSSKITVLDVGCGWGGLTKKLADLEVVEKVIAVDINTTVANSLRNAKLEKVEVYIEDAKNPSPRFISMLDEVSVVVSNGVMRSFTF